MRIKDIEKGMEVKVTRGYSVRPAVVDSVHEGRVSVHFTDTDIETARALGPYNRSGYFGATVRPNQVERAEAE